MNYYQRFLGDYARDTRHLSLMAHGAYSLLLDAYYATEKPLPADLDSLCRICGAINAAERAAVEVIADKFFPVGTDGLRHNKRADIEIAKALPRIAIARANGLRGGRPAGSPTDNPLGSENGTEQEPTGKTALHLHHSSTPTPSTSTKKGKVQSAGRGARLPADWKPDAEQIEFCKSERPDLNPEATAARFRDYWVAQPGQKGVKVDWPATWRNWVRNEKRINGGRPSVADANRLAAEEATRRIRERQ